MKYINAEDVLPESLVKEIQRYTQGFCVYIPLESKKRKGWGENSGTKDNIQNRNESIRKKYRSGYSVDELAEEYFLSTHSIKKIVYVKQICG